jgi:hypothetical protein
VAILSFPTDAPGHKLYLDCSFESVRESADLDSDFPGMRRLHTDLENQRVKLVPVEL